MKRAKILLPVFLALGLICSAPGANAGENAPQEAAGKGSDPKEDSPKPGKPANYDQNAVLFLEGVRKQNLPQQDLKLCPALDPAERSALEWKSDDSGRLALTGLSLQDCNLRGGFSANQHVLSLSELEISGNALSTLNLAGLAGLKRLDASRNMLTRLAGVESLGQLQILTLDYNHISRIENLGKLTKLEELSLYDNSITRVEGLEKLKKLTLLELSSNPITRLEGLENLDSLQELWCYDCEITDISGLDNLKFLEGLDLDGNYIRKIQGLEKLEGLQTLELSRNRIEKIEGLENLPNLQLLTLNKNKINKLEGLGNLKGLTRLEIEGNKLEKLEGLEGLAKLEVLDLCHNRLTSLAGLPAKLREVHLNNNSIPLSELYSASQTWKAGGWFYGTQRDVFGSKELQTGHVYDLAREALIGGKETAFYVFHAESGKAAALGVEYRLDGGRVTFLRPGDYKVSMFNPALISQLPAHNDDGKDDARFKARENGNPARAVTGVITVKD